MDKILDLVSFVRTTLGKKSELIQTLNGRCPVVKFIDLRSEMPSSRITKVAHD